MEHLDHPSPPHFNDAKMARFALRASSSLPRGGWGLIVPFYTVQDCLRFLLAWLEVLYIVMGWLSWQLHAEKLNFILECKPYGEYIPRRDGKNAFSDTYYVLC